MIRYIAWAIPSVGFIGTVRGIGEALGQAHKALEGDIFEVTKSLGVAFNSTLIALLISIVLMFLLHQLQLLQERYVLDVEGEADFFRAVGLVQGDVVRRVNSMEMTNRNRAEYFIREFVVDRVNAFVIDIERDGEPTRLMYHVREGSRD